MFLSEWREFPSVPCLARGGNLMTARVLMSFKSRVSPTRFRACSLPGRAKDLSAPQYHYRYFKSLALTIQINKGRNKTREMARRHQIATSLKSLSAGINLPFLLQRKLSNYTEEYGNITNTMT